MDSFESESSLIVCTMYKSNFSSSFNSFEINPKSGPKSKKYVISQVCVEAVRTGLKSSLTSFETNPS